MRNPTFRLGGGVDDTAANYADVREEYGAVSSGDVRDRGINISVHDCSAKGQWNPIPANSMGRAVLCFMVDKPFQPDGLLVGADTGHIDHHGTCYYPAGFTISAYYQHAYTEWPLCAVQVVPLSNVSSYCFDRYFGFCQADNIQWIDRLAGEPRREPPASTNLQHTIYYNGTVIMVFDVKVVVRNQDRIGVVTDVYDYAQNKSYTSLGNATLSTVDDKRASTILVLDLDDDSRDVVDTSLDQYAELTVIVDRDAIFVAEDGVDITVYHGNQTIVFNSTALVQ